MGRAETLRSLQLGSDSQSRGLQNFIRFCEGPAGKDGGPRNDPNRSLNSRRDSEKKQSWDSGIFKAVGMVENWEEVGLPHYLKKCNGRPALITKSGSIVEGRNKEWMEITVDVG